MSELKALMDAELAASRALAKIDNQIHEYKTAERTKYENIIRGHIDATWSQSRIAAIQAQREAVEAVTAEKERIALASTEHPFPVGAKLSEWRYQGSRYLSNNLMTQTGRTGISEVITAESIHSDTLKWSKAKRGDFVVRIIKKDGKPSAIYESRIHTITNYWFPEGVNPNQQTAQ